MDGTFIEAWASLKSFCSKGGPRPSTGGATRRQIFGLTKPVSLLRKTRHRGRERLAWVWTFTLAAYNLVRMRNLLIQGAY